MIKGYVTSEGYFGFIDGRYVLFATEEEFLECISSG